MKKIKFSVIVPVFNAEKHLKKCFESLFIQTLRDIEIIAIDDGSSDSSLLKLKEMANNEPRLKVFSQQNSGPSAARNLGIANSKGAYISFVDSDDWLESNTFELLEKHISANNLPDIVMFNSYINDAIKNKPFLKSGIYKKHEIREFIYPRLIESLDKSKGSAIRASVWLRVFKRDLIFNKIWFENSLSNNEDLVFCFTSSIKANTFLYLGNSYLYHNCITRGSISRGYMTDAFKRMKPLFGILSDISEAYLEYDFNNQIKARVFRTLIFCFENEFHPENNTSFIDRYTYIKNLMNDELVKLYLSKFTPSKEKSKILYYYYYKNRMVILTMILAKYRSRKQNKRLRYV